jgi:hypothetical protein
MGPRQQPRGLWIETTAGAHDGSASAYGPASGLRSASGLDLRSQRPEEAGSFRASPDLGPPRPKDAIHSRGLGSSLGAFGSRQSLGSTTDRRLLTDRSLNLRGSLEEPLERGNRWGPRRIGAGSRISVWLVSGVWLGFALPEAAGSPGALNELPKQIS